jgi:thiamine pyrophosphate-dependent acetolactate synthase large subunit-like protein
MPARNALPDRRAVVAALAAARGDAAIVTSLGSPTWDLAAVGDDPRNFYLWGAMGGATMTALGIALAQPARRVVALCGDGEMLMAVGSLATVAVMKPANLAILVLDNGHYLETGGQRSHTQRGCDLAVMARGAGFRTSLTCDSPAQVGEAVSTALTAAGPAFVTARVGKDAPPVVLPERDGRVLKQRMRAALA